MAMRKVFLILFFLLGVVGLNSSYAFGVDADHDVVTNKEAVMKKASARHILVETKEACEDLKSRIEGGEDFGKLAQEHSKCPSGKQGGSLGEFFQGQMVSEFDEVVFTAEVGKVHGPVKTDFGYHLIEITQRVD